MTTRTVIHDGHHDAEIEMAARGHGALIVAHDRAGHWTVIDSDGGVHTVHLGDELRCIYAGGVATFKVHGTPCRIRIRLVDGLWEGRLYAPQVPAYGLWFCAERTHANAVRCADEVLEALRTGWRPSAWDEARSPQRMQVLPPEQAEVPA